MRMRSELDRLERDLMSLYAQNETLEFDGTTRELVSRSKKRLRRSSQKVAVPAQRRGESQPVEMRQDTPDSGVKPAEREQRQNAAPTTGADKLTGTRAPLTRKQKEARDAPSTSLDVVQSSDGEEGESRIVQ